MSRNLSPMLVGEHETTLIVKKWLQQKWHGVFDFVLEA